MSKENFQNNFNKKKDKKLNSTEHKVLELLVQGKTLQEASLETGIKKDETQGIIKSIFKKLGARDRMQAVIKALRLGYIEVDEKDL